ncbi:MAG: TetR/AcrR family transcriptional regulator [Parvibaculaceae bacterium]|nr:TetR/AcrR family transcriptional regulator [Parvibaculaceae bacterium]
MSRSRKVAPEEAVQAAMEAFWKHGYHELGTRQLEEETGITRFTLQTTYGGKKKLFLNALDR